MAVDGLKEAEAVVDGLKEAVVVVAGPQAADGLKRIGGASINKKF